MQTEYEYCVLNASQLYRGVVLFLEVTGVLVQYLKRSTLQLTPVHRTHITSLISCKLLTRFWK